MGEIPASLYLWDICHLYCSLSPADLATRLQWFSYQLNDTISPIGIAEHCSFIQLWWYDLANWLGRGVQLLGRKAVLFLFRMTTNYRHAHCKLSAHTKRFSDVEAKTVPPY